MTRDGRSYNMSCFGFVIFKDSISFDEPAWICFHDIHMYIESSLFRLLKLVVTEFKHDKHLAM